MKRRIADHRDEIIRRYKAGEKTRDLAAAFGFAQLSIQNFLTRELGPNPGLRHRYHLKLASKAGEIAARYKAGETTATLASEHGVHVNTITNLLRRHFGSAPSAHRPTKLRHRWPEIIELFRTGEWTTSRLAAHFGCSKQGIVWCLRNSLPPDEYERLVKGLTASGSKHYNWRGGKKKNADGYREVLLDGRYVLEHRHVAAQILDREIDRKEHVHHIDGNPLNNSPENLAVLSNSAHHRLEGAVLRLLGQQDPELLQRLSREAAELEGLEVIWLSEHVAPAQ